jgi:hypothetical protein
MKLKTGELPAKKRAAMTRPKMKAKENKGKG